MELDSTDPFYLMTKFIPKEHWDYMMFMGKSEGITLYKHCSTRHYANVDKEGNFYKYNCGKYEKINREDALANMLK